MATQADSGRLQGGFFLERQSQSNWCWAAIGVALANYLKGDQVSQCELVQATRAPAGVDCCQTPDHQDCNAMERVSAVLGELHLATRPSPSQPQGVVSYDVIKRDIGNDRPLICMMSGATGDHYVIIVGWFLSDGMPWLIVDDPEDGHRKRTSFDDFFNFEQRQWVQTTRLA